KAWGGPSAEPQVYSVSTHQARVAGVSFLSCAISSLRLGQWLSPTSRACAINPDRSWGSATLHSRLYSAARIRGLKSAPTYRKNGKALSCHRIRGLGFGWPCKYPDGFSNQTKLSYQSTRLTFMSARFSEFTSKSP